MMHLCVVPQGALQQQQTHTHDAPYARNVLFHVLCDATLNDKCSAHARTHTKLNCCQLSKAQACVFSVCLA
jgi:hypothetical protein